MLKVCCIQSAKEAETAISSGADLLGFVADGTGDWGPISIRRIASIVAGLPGGTRSVLLTSATDISTLIDRCEKVRPYALQLTDGLAGDPAALRESLGETRIFFTVHVTGAEVIEKALSASKWADALMLDSGFPDATEKVLGATGRPHDWSISAEIVRSVSCPVFLAGGINMDNVERALRTVSPAGVDVASGVRLQGDLAGSAVRGLSEALQAGLKGRQTA
jgi:phosphoribosylanthranilate isomerase